jgi:hypothetical protein
MKDDSQLEFDTLGLAREIKAPSHLKQRWHDSIDLAAQRELHEQKKSAGTFSMSSFFWGSAVTAALALGIAIGVFVTDEDEFIEPTEYIVQDRGNSFNRVMQVHLRDTRNDIASMPIDTNEDRTLLVLQIIQQNRLFEQAAERNDADGLARVLRAFEPILLQLAANDIAPEDAAALRDQLAFQLKVMLTKLERSTSKETTST